MSNLAMIVAASENGVIGNMGELPWRLSADLRRFKQLTMGHHQIMGRKTFESIGRLLPGRTTVIITRQSEFQCSDAKIADSVAATLEIVAEDEQPFVVGGAEIYQLFLPSVTQLHLTRVHCELAGDTYLPPIDWEQWTRKSSTRFSADEKNNFDYSFEFYRRARPM